MEERRTETASAEIDVREHGFAPARCDRSAFVVLGVIIYVFGEDQSS